MNGSCAVRHVMCMWASQSRLRRGADENAGKGHAAQFYFLCIYLFVSDHMFINYYRQTDTDGHRPMASTADA